MRSRSCVSSALNVEVSCWFATTDWDEFTLIRQELLLGFLGVVESAGSALACQTLALAPGATPRRLPSAIAGDLGGVFTVRDKADGRRRGVAPVASASV